jgi:DNA-binding SARP family transcriptional activator/DNA-binding NarL/FixJ family response regulator
MSNNSHTILVVDPDERSYKTFESVLGSKNRVWFVPNGKTAINLPDSHNIDIVFISHVLNGTDGIMLLESFKKRFPSIPVVLIAEQPKIDEVITAFRSGARELIIKPLDEKELIAVTTKICRFVSNKKPKRRWFFQAKKDTQKYNLEKNSPGHLKKIFQKSKQRESSTVFESDEFQIKDTVHLGDDSNSSLIVDTLVHSEQPDNGSHTITPIESTNPLIEAFFFGPLRVLVNDRSIENWPSKKGKSIFAYLLLNHRKKIFRDVLMDLFWQKSDPDSARNCLNVTIHGLRRVLQDKDPQNDYIFFKDECYYFNPELDIRLDVDKFRSTWRKAQSIEHEQNLSAAVYEYERVAAIYKGEFLEDELYDNLSSIDRENLKEIYLVILNKISLSCMLNKNYRNTIRLCEDILNKDNCSEQIYRRLMECYYRIGQRDKALKLFRKCSKILRDELDVKPETTTIELYRKIRENQL